MGYFFAQRMLLSLMLILGRPHASQILIPPVQQAPAIDGQCNDFDEAMGVTFTEKGHTMRIFMAHDRDALFVCMQAPKGLLYERWIGIYLDPQGDGSDHTFAQSDDWSLHVNLSPGRLDSFVGNGQGNYVQTAAPTVLQSQRVIGTDMESAEFRIPMYGLHLGECNRPFGMAVAHQWVNAVADDYFWPAGAEYNQPASWMQMTMTNTLCPADLNKQIYFPMFLYGP